MSLFEVKNIDDDNKVLSNDHLICNVKNDLGYITIKYIDDDLSIICNMIQIIIDELKRRNINNAVLYFPFQGYVKDNENNLVSAPFFLNIKDKEEELIEGSIIHKSKDDKDGVYVSIPIDHLYVFFKVNLNKLITESMYKSKEIEMITKPDDEGWQKVINKKKLKKEKKRNLERELYNSRKRLFN